jgi:exoribonuclease R
MLLANRAVAEYVSKIKVKQRADLSYRTHDDPDPESKKKPLWHLRTARV